MPLLSKLRPPVVEEVFFAAGAHRLHGELAYPETGSPEGAVVIAGPHPLLGGHMHNNVVRGLGDGLATQGTIALRFNYRGVGRSEGPDVDVVGNLAQFWATSHVSGEMEWWHDLASAASFMRQVARAELPLALIGYSFGCALLPFLHRKQSPAAYVLIAPTVAKHDYAAFIPLAAPKLVIASEDDFATDGEQLHSWYEKLRSSKRLVEKRLDNHFFRGHEEWLVKTVMDFLREHWS